MGNKIYHRLDVEDRMVIQACLHDHMTLTQIFHLLPMSANRRATKLPTILSKLALASRSST